MPNTVTWEQEGAVAVLTMRHSPVNALHSSVLGEIEDCLWQLKAGQRTRAVVILSSSDKVFATTCARRNTPEKDEGRLHQLLRHLTEISVPVIAVIAGAALGAGFELALACDLRIAGEYARFGFPDVSYGTLPTAITASALREAVGAAKAKELIWSGRLIGAKEAYGLGLVNAIVPDSHLIEEGIAMAHSLASLPPQAVEAGKRLGEQRKDRS